MCARRIGLPILCVLFGAGALLLIWRSTLAATPASGVYRVTPWPNDSPETPYHREVEEHLNRMAAEGYRFHSELAAQPGRMMVFEKSSR